MYIGNNLQVADSGNKIIDDISSGFNGSTTSFALQVGGAAPVPFPINTQQVYISVNGVIQEPDPTGSAGFKISGNNIVFSSAPTNGHAFFGVILAGADYVTVGTEFPAGSATAPSMTFTGDTNTGWYSVSSGTVGFTADGVQTFTADASGFNFPDSKAVNIGTGTDLIIKSDGTTSFLQSQDLKLRNKAGDEDYLTCTADGAVSIFYNNSSKFQTTNTGTNVTGIHVDDGATHDGDVTFTGASYNVTWDKSADDLIFADNAKAAFGIGSDLTVYHDGTDSYINNATNELIFKTGSNFEFQVNASEVALKATANGAVELYYDSELQCKTHAAGLTVKTAGDTDSELRVTGPEGRAGVLILDADDADDNADIWRMVANTDGTLAIQNYAAGSYETNIKATGNAAVEIYHDNSLRLSTTADGADFSGTGSLKLPVGTTAQRSGSPTAGDMRYNSTLSQFEGYTSAWGALGGGATGGGSDTVFFENGQTVTTDYTITNNMNAGSFGPITINSGVTVTVGSGEVWTVV